MDLVPVLILVISFLIFIMMNSEAWSIALSSLLTLLVSIPSLAVAITIVQRMGTGLDSFALLAIFLYLDNS